jgi:hypothetical protein
MGMQSSWNSMVDGFTKKTDFLSDKYGAVIEEDFFISLERVIQHYEQATKELCASPEILKQVLDHLAQNAVSDNIYYKLLLLKLAPRCYSALAKTIQRDHEFGIFFHFIAEEKKQKEVLEAKIEDLKGLPDKTIQEFYDRFISLIPVTKRNTWTKVFTDHGIRLRS